MMSGQKERKEKSIILSSLIERKKERKKERKNK